MKRILLAAFTLCAAAWTQAGTLKLSNGDVIEGDLVSASGGQLVWASTNFGELSIDASLVQSVNTDSKFKLAHSDEPCQLSSGDQTNLNFDCSNSPAEVAVAEIELMTFDAHLASLEPVHEYSGYIDVNGLKSSGNTEKEDFDVALGVELQLEKWRHNLDYMYEGLSVNNSDNEKIAVDETMYLTYNAKWFAAEHWYIYGVATTGKDEKKSIKEAYTGGAGGGYEFWNEGKDLLSTELGYSWLKEHYNQPADASDDFVSPNETDNLRWAANYTKLLPWELEFFYKHVFLQNLDESKDWRYYGSTGLMMPFNDNLYGKISADYDYDNTPVEGTVEDDTTYKIGISYNW